MLPYYQGGGGASSTSSTYLTNQILQTTNPNGTTSTPIISGMINVKISNLRGGGGGGGGANLYQSTSKDNLVTSASFNIPSTGITNLRAQLMGSGGGGAGGEYLTDEYDTSFGAMGNAETETTDISSTFASGKSNFRLYAQGAYGIGGPAYFCFSGNYLTAGAGGGGDKGAIISLPVPTSYFTAGRKIVFTKGICKVNSSFNSSNSNQFCINRG